MKAQAVAPHALVGAPWYVNLLIVSFPALLAIILTVGSMCIVKRVNRDLQRPPMRDLGIVLWSLGLGAMYGPILQLGFQRLAAWLIGMPVYFELVLVAPFVVGPGSVICARLLEWQARKRWPMLYALLQVRHDPHRGHVGRSDTGDFTAEARRNQEARRH